MKRFFSISLLLLAAAAAVAGPISQYPQASAVASNDLVLIDQWSGGTNYTTKVVTGSNFLHSVPTVPVSIANGGTGQTTARSAGTNIGTVEMSALGAGSFLVDMNNATSAFDGQLGVSFSDGSTEYLWAAEQAGKGTNGWGADFAFPGTISSIGWRNFTDLPFSDPDGLNFQWVLNDGPAETRLTNVWNGSQLADQLWFFKGRNPFSDSGISVSMYGTNSAFGGEAFTNGDGVKFYEQSAYGWTIDSIPDADPAGKANLAGSYSLISSGAFPCSLSVNSGYPGVGVAWQVPYFVADLSNYVANNSSALPVGFPAAIKQNTNWLTGPLASLGLQWAFVVNEQMQSGIGAATYLTNGTSYVSNLFNGYIEAPNGGTYYNSAGTPAGNFVWGASAAGYDQSAPFSVNNATAVFSAPSGGHAAYSYDAGASYHRLGFVITPGNYPMLAAASGAPWQIAHSSSGDIITGNSSQTATPDVYGDASTVVVTNGEKLTSQGGIVPVVATLNLNSSATIYSNTFSFPVNTVQVFLQCNTNDASTGFVAGQQIDLRSMYYSTAIPSLVAINGDTAIVSVGHSMVGSEASFGFISLAGGAVANPTSFSHFTLVIKAE
jgi:hypothetical protein